MLLETRRRSKKERMLMAADVAAEVAGWLVMSCGVQTSFSRSPSKPFPSAHFHSNPLKQHLQDAVMIRMLQSLLVAAMSCNASIHVPPRSTGELMG
jgi:hypothetical protein